MNDSKLTEREKAIAEFCRQFTLGVLAKFSEMRLDIREQLTVIGDLELNTLARHQASHTVRSQLAYALTREVIEQLPGNPDPARRRAGVDFQKKQSELGGEMNETLRYRALICVWRNNPEFHRDGILLGNWLATWRTVLKKRFAPSPDEPEFRPLLPRQEAVRLAVLAAEQAAEADMQMRHAGARYVSAAARARREVRHG